MRILVIRLGAWGDSIILTPFLRFLKSEGHEVYLHTSETGMTILKGNPNVDKFLPYVSNSVPDDKLQEHWEKLRKENGCEEIVNLCESIERAVSFHPIDPMYSWTKSERLAWGDKNFYEYMFTHAGRIPAEKQDEKSFYRPEMFFTEEEETKMRNFFNQDKKAFWIVWGLSGSGLNKSYPYSDFVIAEILQKHKDVKVVTVGDELCQILEALKDKRVIRRSGIWSMREASLAARYANLVVAPDTGLLHAAGCFDTPKIGIIGSNTINQITKHFTNDYSIQADSSIVPCAPCLRLIYSASQQCPIEENSGICKCMALGISPHKIVERIGEVIGKHKDVRSLQSV